MTRRKPMSSQRGFAFLPPQQQAVVQGVKQWCMGPHCKRHDHRGVLLPITAFPKAKKNHGAFCKICTAEIKMRAKYGVKLEEFERILLDQHNVCAICKKRETKGLPLVIDYNFKAKKLQGLICDDCYRKWIQFNWIVDHAEWIEAAMKYREGYKHGT